MSVYVMRACLIAGESSRNLCCHYQNHVSKLQRTTLQLPFSLRNSLKTTNWNYSRWPGKRQLEIKPLENQFQDNYSFSRLWKPFVFTLSVSGVTLVGAAIWQYENVRAQASRTKSWWGSHTPKYGLFRQHMHGWWNSLSPGDKTFAPICALNLLVFLAWMVPAWRPIMTRYFTAGLGTNVLCWPMLLSVFSHYSIFHLGANMFVLHSFSEKAVSVLGREQFLAMYITGGMVSSFASYLYKAALRSSTTSLGASGAVMCVLAYICSKYPHSHLAIIFIPQFPFEAGTGLKALMCMDTLGCVLRWSFFDHAAHLGGSLFGVFWYYFGYEYIWKRREPIVSAWHKARGPV